MIKCTLIVLCSTRLYPVVEPYARALDSCLCGTRPFITCLSFWIASFGSISSSDQTIDISKCNQGRTKSPNLANRCIHLAQKFHSQSIVILMLRPLSCVHHSKPSFHFPPTLTYPITHSSTFPALPVTRRLSPAPMGPRRPASLPPRSLRLVVSTSLIHTVVSLGPWRRTAPVRVAVGWRETLAWCWDWSGDVA
jgi:hypothetical protein